MKKILIALSLLASQSAFADACGVSLTGVFPAPQAAKLCATFLGSSTVSATIVPGTTNSYDLGSAAATFRTLYLGTNLKFTAASAKILPGATSLLFQNNADSATNLGITDAGVVTARAGLATTAGNLTFGAASAKIIPGATSLILRNNADDATNFTMTNAGAAVFTGTVTSSNSTTIGWSVVAGANTACSTTCTSACVMGVNTAATEADIVDCADATADECLCAGAS
jgi:hypothetical protein